MTRKISDVIAIIPARGGSQRIPRKNLIRVAGRPMLSHTIDHARKASCLSSIYVSTDDDEIAVLAQQSGAEVIRRPADLSTAVAASESALLHVLDSRRERGLEDPALVVFLQCTSPVRRHDDIDRAVDTLIADDADSLFSAHRDAAFVWQHINGKLQSITYDYQNRGRSQDRPPQFIENGSLWVFKPWVLRQFGNRLGGRISVYEMDYFCSFDIDTLDQLEIVENILRRPQLFADLDLLKTIELVVFDFDGVMTDNTLLVDESGQESVRCNRSDGLGISALRRGGIESIVFSTEENAVVAARCTKLEISCHQGLADKAAHLRDYLNSRHLSPDKVLFLGNDVNDLGCLELVGMPVVVADAHPAAAAKARLVLTRNGGDGAVRELCDLLLSSHGQG
jgi:N-acylneuraminate cytidylyltransferase